MRDRRRRPVPPNAGPPPSGGHAPLPGYRLGPPLGFGARGAVWSATGPDGTRCAVTYLDVPLPQRGATQRRLRRLASARHPGTAAVLAVVDVPTGCAVVSERVDGPTLAALRAARGPLDPAEVAFVVRALGEALAHLHAHGVVHGDVSPANVVLAGGEAAAGDRPVLVDLVGEVTVERGTDPFVAPERRAGTPAGWPGDVWSLASTALWLVAPRERERAATVLAPALAAEPDRRCSAEELASLVRGLGEPRPVDMPEAAVLAHGSLRASAAFDRTTTARRRRLRGRGSGRRRAPGRRVSGQRAAALVGGVAAGIGLGALLLGPPAAPDPAGLEDSIAGRVAALVALRDAAVAAADADALGAVTVPGSPAARYDAELLDSLGRAGVRVTGLRTVVEEIDVWRVDAQRASVAVVARQDPHVRTSEAGGTDVVVPAQPARCALLALRSDEGRWRVWDVGECDPAEEGEALSG